MPLSHQLENHNVADETWSQVASGLAWFGICLGVMEIAAPRKLAQVSGLPERTRLLQWFGAREIGAGLAILLADKCAPGLWARVAGDALDLTVMGAALVSPGSKKDRLAFATAAVVGVAVLDVIAARKALTPQLAS